MACREPTGIKSYYGWESEITQSVLQSEHGESGMETEGVNRMRTWPVKNQFALLRQRDYRPRSH